MSSWWPVIAKPLEPFPFCLLDAAVGRFTTFMIGR